LAEYLKKKKYYQEHGIEIEFLDKEFDITRKDTIKIRAFLRDDKKMYDENRHQDYVDPGLADFPSSNFKKDPRFDRIKTKQKRDSDAQNQRHNYGLISRGYDMYRNDRPFASAAGDDFNKSKINPTNEWFGDKSGSESDDDWNENVAKVMKQKSSFNKRNTYVNPRSVHNGYLSANSMVENDRRSVDSIIGKIDSYREKVTRPYNHKNEMDYYGKRVLPNNRNNEKREYANNYQAVPHRESGEFDRNIDVDTMMRFGNAPIRGGKSMGYPNPVEHYFGFISDDIQAPEHTVFERGIPSRSFNKSVARPRDVMK
jgi:hypothetical protein